MERSRGFPPRPVQLGDVIDLTIDDTGSKGDGIGRVKGFVVFVPGTKKGDTVKVKITQVRRRSAVGEVVE